MAKKDRKKCRFSPLFQTQKRSTVTACVVVAVLPIFYALILFYPGRKERMDVRSRRRCGNVYNWPYYGAVGNGVYRMWESPGFSMCCECVFPSVEWSVMHISTVLISLFIHNILYFIKTCQKFIQPIKFFHRYIFVHQVHH